MRHQQNFKPGDKIVAVPEERAKKGWLRIKEVLTVINYPQEYNTDVRSHPFAVINVRFPNGETELQYDYGWKLAETPMQAYFREVKPVLL